MIENIFAMLELGELTDAEAIMALYINHFGATSESDLKQKLNKSSRSIDVYFKKLVTKRIISKRGNVFKMQNSALNRKTDYKQDLQELKSKDQSINLLSANSNKEQDPVDIRAEICKILSSVGKGVIADAILNDVELAIANNPTYTFNADAFTNILSRVERIYSSGKIKKTYVGYLKTSIANDWAKECAEVLLQKQQKKNDPGKQTFTVPVEKTPSVEAPQGTPEANDTWQMVIRELKQELRLPAFKTAILRAVMPVEIKDGNLQLWVDNDLDREKFEEFRPMVVHKLMQRNLKYCLIVENPSLKSLSGS